MIEIIISYNYIFIIIKILITNEMFTEGYWSIIGSCEGKSEKLKTQVGCRLINTQNRL